MAKTLLEYVQDILSTCDSDDVNSISDTYEAMQVAKIVKNVFYDMVSENNLPTKKKLRALESVSDVTKPTHLKIPDNVSNVLWWKYDVRTGLTDPFKFATVDYLEPQDFLNICNSRDSLDTTHNFVVQLDADVEIVVGKNAGPRYWTTFDNTYIVCDSYDSTVDTTLQQTKTQAMTEETATFLVEDTFVPPIPAQLEMVLYRTAENLAYALLKQAVNPKLEKKEKQMRIRVQRNKTRVESQQNPFKETVSYGRR
jgi:hypothetical protein